jgi:hypothetical protein
MATNINDCELISIHKITNRAGNIAVVESDKLLPFSIKRIYYLYDIPAGKSRGGHAHRELRQLLVAASGSFEVELFDGLDRKKVFLNRPDIGLLIVPGIWRELTDFSSGSVCLVLASEVYSESDYFYDMNSFLNFKLDA